MPNLKISELANSGALAGNELVPIVQSGETVKNTSQGIADLYQNRLVENIVYNDLYDKVVNGELVPGKLYRLTDYKSVNFLNGILTAADNPIPTDPNFDPLEIYVGEEEVLILEAVTPYSISDRAYSETYNQDVISYVPLVNKIGLSLFVDNGSILPDSSTVSGFDLQWDGTNAYFNMPTGYPILFGHYLEIYADFGSGDFFESQYNTVFQNDVESTLSYGDFTSRIRVENNGTKVVLLDLTESQVLDYVANTLYISHVYALGDSYGFVNRRIDTSRNIDLPFDFRNRKYRRFEVDLTGIVPGILIGYFGIGDDYLGQGTTGNFQDFSTFNDASNFVWSNISQQDDTQTPGLVDNVVFIDTVTNVRINSNNFTNSTINDTVRDISMNVDFVRDVVIGDDFVGSTLNCSELSNSVFGRDIRNSVISTELFIDVRIGVDFTGNLLNCSEFIGNEFDDSFLYNQIFENFSSNTSTSGNPFVKNMIKTEVTSVNFTTATHVFGYYSCDIINNSTFDLRLIYLNGSNVPQYVSITA